MSCERSKRTFTSVTGGVNRWDGRRIFSLHSLDSRTRRKCASADTSVEEHLVSRWRPYPVHLIEVICIVIAQPIPTRCPASRATRILSRPSSTRSGTRGPLFPIVKVTGLEQ